MLFDDQAQAVDPFSKVDRSFVQIDVSDINEHLHLATSRSSSAIHAGVTEVGI
jgi:hypothetical protein